MKKLHLICGMCGCSEMLSYRIREELNDDTNKSESIVYISCKNCSTLTGLDEHINQETN